MARAKTIFTQDELTIWGKLLTDRKPRQIEEIEWPEFTQIEAFRPMALSHGMALRFAARDGSEHAFIINPVAARHLAASILLMGQEAGWLDAEANVICPPMPALDA